MSLTLMTVQRAAYARHQYVTPQGRGAYGNRIVRWWRECGRWGGGGQSRNEGIKGSKGGGGGAGQSMS